MNLLESDEQKYRVIVALVAIFITIFVVGVFALILPVSEAKTGQINVGDVLFDRSSGMFPATLQNLMWLMFFIGLGEMWVRHNRSAKELEQLKLYILPEEDDVMLRAKDLVPIYTGICERKVAQHFFVQRLTKRVILQFQGSNSADQANSLMNSSLELMQHEIELKFNMLRYLVWLIPTLGFIGTVVGIALALSSAADMPDVSDTDAIREWLGLLTTDLGLAFNTTLVALIMSAILVFLLHIVQAREEMALNNAGQYCMDNLINRLYENK
ncbi:MotA/TolQ/ExbB proton channel family protein [Alteromonas stellipolaris]|uniref:MotA/TolQ/ExbB proton channel family protein n=1 Tax=Alteromonas stellipolaris TaxID=233316 RepID=UPI001D2B8BDA|nr:MotA/TolQ/ExbB proton channel family protein [Alteromonas stellipolaris]MBZ2163566.1 MotA/TolQ/ExbB proton channel family protein [Alteromonas stellipolaris]MDP2535960.1 MotA/TolQ/ExbB proton channel family protein [Alteromonas stellipolaris]MDP2594996.1 MotA/TolQ/ExbB proton channel family protein [Alteromonas stellipolaris]